MQAKPSYLQVSLHLGGLLILIAVAWQHTWPPNRDTPLTTPFSIDRAMQHVQRIGARPHPTGTRENDTVRQYLLQEITRLDFKPQVQSAFVVNPQKQLAGRVQNVLVKVPGVKSGKAVLLVAHYDSVPTGPGAADDGASVAALLESLRVLKDVPTLQNDIIFLFTDGEEAGLLGAKAFIDQHPWAKDIGIALNFEYRGNRGAFMMFETSVGNGGLIEALAQSTSYVLANSLMYEVYKHLPNDTDFTVFKNAGIPGMNFAAIEGHTHYHTALDRPEFLAQTTLQQEGDLMLGLIRHLGNSAIDKLTATDQIYFDLPLYGIAHYPVAWQFALNIALVLLFVSVIVIAFKKPFTVRLYAPEGAELVEGLNQLLLKHNDLRLGKLLIGVYVFSTMLTIFPLAGQGLWWAIGKLHPEYASFAQGDTYNSHWYLIAFILLTVTSYSLTLHLVLRWLTALEFNCAVLVIWLVLTLVSTTGLPGASYVFFWPLAAMLLAVWLTLLLRLAPLHPVNNLILLVASILAVLLYVPLIKGLFIGLTPHKLAAVVAVLTLLLGLLTPLLVSFNALRGFKLTSLVGGLIALVIGSMTSRFDAEHPRQDQLFYALNPSLQQAFWLSSDKHLDKWSAAYFPDNTKRQSLPAIFGHDEYKYWLAKAPVADYPAPAVTVLQDVSTAQQRLVTLAVKSLRDAPHLQIQVEGAVVLQSTVAKQSYNQLPERHWQLEAYGLRNEGLTISLTLQPGIHFTLRAIDSTYSLPDFLPQPRPEDSIPKPSKYSNNTLVVTTINF